MDAPLSLQPCRLTPELLKSPMPFDVFNGKGMLLIKKGTLLQGDGDVVLAQSLFRSRDPAENDSRECLQRLEALYQRYGAVMDAWSGRDEEILEVRRLAGDLVHLCAGPSDLCVATASHLKGKRHAVKHSFVAAIVAILIGNALGWHLRRQHTLARGALTMNLSQLPQHDAWARNRFPLSEIDRRMMRQHPGLSAELLVHSPCVDLDWFTAVDQHHENLDGSGYPVGLKGEFISPEARVLRVADTWCALVLMRCGKSRKTPKEAMTEMKRRVGSHFDARAFQALSDLMGVYPPGTFVRLANRETAIVTRWDKHGALPKFATSVLSPTGETAREYKVRPLTQRGFEIRNYTYLDMAQMARFSVSDIWAAEAA